MPYKSNDLCSDVHISVILFAGEWWQPAHTYLCILHRFSHWVGKNVSLNNAIENTRGKKNTTPNKIELFMIRKQNKFEVSNISTEYFKLHICRPIILIIKISRFFFYLLKQVSLLEIIWVWNFHAMQFSSKLIRNATRETERRVSTDGDRFRIGIYDNIDFG